MSKIECILMLRPNIEYKRRYETPYALNPTKIDRI
jgi:hypothetical protein